MTDMDRWTELYDMINKNALAGPDKISFEFFLVDKVDVINDDIETIKDMIDTSSNHFCVMYNLEEKVGKAMFLNNIRYLVGYYGDERETKWRLIVSDYYKVK